MAADPIAIVRKYYESYVEKDRVGIKTISSIRRFDHAVQSPSSIERCQDRPMKAFCSFARSPVR